MSYRIYKRTTPDGKVYIGCTSISLEARAGIMGRRYQTRPSRFSEAIDKYGWESITSEVLAETESLEEARRLEEFYINQYDATNPECGYNTLEISTFCTTPELREKIAKCTSESMNSDVKARMSEAIKRSPQFRESIASPEHRVRCSIAAKKRWESPEERAKQSKAVKESSIYQAAIAKPGYRERRLEAVNSVEARAKRSQAIKGRIHIFRGNESKMIFPEQLQEYLDAGWERGRAPRKHK